jgi:ADP-ribosylglycohydrolase
MRSAVIGCFFADDEQARLRFTKVSARVTHTDPRAITGAQLVALAASCATTGTEDRFADQADALAPDWEEVVSEGAGPTGASGFVLQTVPAALGCWARYPHSLAAAIEEAVALGGDTDTVAAIAGGVTGCSRPRGEVPEHWLRWVGWPSLVTLKRLSHGPVPDPPFAVMAATHAATLPVLLAHGFRRVAPPY